MEKTHMEKFNVTDFSITDMTQLYAELSYYGIGSDTSIPPVLVLPGDVESINTYEKEIICLTLGEKNLSRKKLSAEILASIKNYEKDGFSTKTDMSMYYLIGANLAQSLNIQCPQIIVSDNEGVVNATYNTLDNRRSYCIVLKKQNDCRETILCLAHEMRHAWQHEKHSQLYFKDYNYDLIKTDLKSYLMQEAEIDADAYAYRMMKDVFNVNWKPNRKFPEVNQVVADRSKKISTHYTDVLLLLGKNMFGSNI